MELKPDSIWTIAGDKTLSLQDFKKQYFPKMALRKQVSEDVFNELEVIYKLLVHSYYEYKFIDVAVSKLLHTFEMALKIRFKELNNQTKGVPKNLHDLIEWFRINYYFELTNKDYLHNIRKVRNIVSHPDSHTFGGIAKFHWFEQIIDLINDIHSDVEERIERHIILEKVNWELSQIIENGAKINFFGESLITYEVQCFLHHKGKYYGYFKSIFKPEVELNEDEHRPYNFGFIEFEDFKILDGDIFSAGLLKIKKLKKEANLKKYKDWLVQYHNDPQNGMFDHIMNIKLSKKIADIRREVLHSKYF